LEYHLQNGDNNSNNEIFTLQVPLEITCYQTSQEAQSLDLDAGFQKNQLINLCLHNNIARRAMKI
jgi:hypothetical protein